MKRTVLVLLMVLSTTASSQEKTLHIIVDERVELMTMVQLICESPVMTLTSADLGYAREVTERFGRFNHHPAVVLFDSIYFKYFNFEMPFQSILHYALPDLNLVAPLSATEFSPSRGYDQHADTLARFVRELKDLYVRSNFHDFFLAHQRFYDSLCTDVESTLKGINIVPRLEAYYGTSFARYHLVLSPLSLDGGFGITVTNKKESCVYAIIGPAYTSKEYPQFKKNKTIILHEMSHPFSNPVIDSCWEGLGQDTCLYRPVRTSMQKEGYWSWMAVAYETLNRANEVMLTSDILGKEEANALYATYISKRYEYLPLCMDVLKIYRANRETYRSLPDIKPLLLRAFEDKVTKVCR